MKRLIGVMVLLLLAGCGGKKASEAAADVDPLAGTAWELQFIRRTTALPDVPVTVEFKEGRVGGKASCNQYFASYEVWGDSLRIGPAGATKMMCPEPVMEQERIFLEFLQDAKTYRIAQGRLEIFRTDGQALTFAPATADPKED